MGFYVRALVPGFGRGLQSPLAIRFLASLGAVASVLVVRVWATSDASRTGPAAVPSTARDPWIRHRPNPPTRPGSPGREPSLRRSPHGSRASSLARALGRVGHR